tara:strand:+ start:517 stop:657 length:141 start_codon:yes stop_codon:yes gene_type:complete
MTTEVLKQGIELAKANKKIEELEAQLDMAVKFNLTLAKELIEERAK